MAIQRDPVTASLTAQNTFSDAFQVSDFFNVTLSGTFSATATLQKSFDNGTTWHDVVSYTTVGGKTPIYEPQTNVHYRIGVKTGDYTSGTVVCRLSQ